MGDTRKESKSWKGNASKEKQVEIVNRVKNFILGFTRNYPCVICQVKSLLWAFQ